MYFYIYIHMRYISLNAKTLMNSRLVSEFFALLLVGSRRIQLVEANPLIPNHAVHS
jgi:hypothetical protein